MSSMTRFTEDIPETFNKHFYYMDPSKSSGKLCMHIPARWGSLTVRVPFKAWAAFISVSCLTFLCLIMNEFVIGYYTLENSHCKSAWSHCSHTDSLWSSDRVARSQWHFRGTQGCRKKLFQIANTEKCVQGRVFTFTDHDLHWCNPPCLDWACFSQLPLFV